MVKKKKQQKRKEVNKKQIAPKGVPSKEGKKTSKNNEKQATIIIGFMVGLVLILIAIFIIRVGANKFTYEGIDFKKTKYGEIQLYTAMIPKTNSNGDIVGNIEIDFRNDPRDLEYIEVDVDRILFREGLALLSVDDAEKCPDNGIALINLGGIFLRKAGIAAKITYLNQTRAEIDGVPYVTCDNTFKNTVLEIKEGNETSIVQTKNNCYELVYADCDIMMVTEKFQLEMLKDSID